MWTRRTRNLSVRRCTTLFAHALLFAGLCASAALCAVANEERALRQALTIVQLLRAEFNRLVPIPTETPAPTCAPTTADLSSQSNPSRRYWTRYKKPVPQRRMDYDDGFGAHPSPVETPKFPPTTTSELLTSSSQKDSHNAATPLSVIASPVTQSPIPLNTSTLPSSTVSSGKSVPLFSTSVKSDPNVQSTTGIVLTSESSSIHLPSYAESSPITTPVAALQSTVKNISIQTETTVDLVTSKMSSVIKPATHPPKHGVMTTNNVSITPSPELQQVAMELAGELEESDVNQPQKLKLKLKRTTTTLRQTARATWREHLPHSTRYAVPLPENHAFCYTDPNNPLCRTII